MFFRDDSIIRTCNISIELGNGKESDQHVKRPLSTIKNVTRISPRCKCLHVEVGLKQIIVTYLSLITLWYISGGVVVNVYLFVWGF